jgi:hypothetical protein
VNAAEHQARRRRRRQGDDRQLVGDHDERERKMRFRTGLEIQYELSK